jgi:thiosulfate/3-mercaptopyruvate sulfurtransferase
MTYSNPHYLVDTSWLASHLSEPNLRIYDCTTHLIHQNDPALPGPYRIHSGREDYLKAHIPGAAFIDLQGNLSDPESELRFTCLDSDSLIQAFSTLGIGDESRVILYSQMSPQWAARIWWLLRIAGFESASVLDGGLTKWKLEQRAVTDQQTVYPAAQLTTKPRTGLMASKDDVLNAINDSTACTINALRRSQHTGQDAGEFGNYGRPGHISGSVNVPTAELVDSKTTEFLPSQQIKSIFNEIGVAKADRILTYCGGGIAASATAMLLVMLGFDNVSIYDASLSEWAPDKTLPMDTLN